MLSARVKLKAYVQYRILKKFYSKTSKIQPFTEIPEENLFQCPVTVTSKNGKNINLNAVFQDTMPSGSQIGTVVTLHGSSGSHNDFKYINQYLKEWGIRTIGINFPGFGYTSYDSRLTHINTERLQFVQAIIDSIELSKNLIFMGYSRGSENALKMAVINKDKSIGAVLVNATGFRANRALRPEWSFKLGGFLYDLEWKWLRWALERFAYIIFSSFQIKPKNPFVAGLSFKLLTTCNFADQKEYVELANKTELKILNIYSGRDPIIERRVYQEFSNEFMDNLTFFFDRSHDDELQLFDNFLKEINDGTKHVSVNFTKDGHLLVKSQAYFIAKAIEAVFKADIDDEFP